MRYRSQDYKEALYTPWEAKRAFTVEATEFKRLNSIVKANKERQRPSRHMELHMQRSGP